MNKTSLRWIIGLMSISLIGLIAFQAYWLKKISGEKAEEFDQNIKAALYKIPDAIEQKEALFFANQIQTTTNDLEKEKESKITLKFETQNLIRSNGKDSSFKRVETTTKTIRNNNKIEIFSIKDTNDKDVEMISQFLRKRENLSETLDKMALQFAFKDKSLTERLKDINIDSIIDRSISNQGLPKLKYAYVIINKKDDSVVYSNNEQMNLEQTYEVSLFEDNISNQSGTLQFSIPEKATFILQSIWPSLFGSIILTLILINTFGYTLHSIYKQKKITKVKSDFINNMTHEFKTPVATISLAIDTMMHREIKKNPKELEHYGSIIKKENQRMNDQIERLLEIALFDREEIELNFQEVDCHAMLQEIKQDFELKSISENGSIHLIKEANNPIVLTDKLHLYNVFKNLVDNAIKYSENNFNIRIETVNVADALIIKVADKGIGMNQETIKNIFKRFYRKSTGDLHTVKGFGLGLAYAKEILERMNANISVESQLGKGSLFIIKIQSQNNEA